MRIASKFAPLFLCALAALAVSVFSGAKAAKHYDFGGATIRIRQDDDSFSDEEGRKWKTEVERMFNCKIEILRTLGLEHDYKAFEASVLSGKPMADILFMDRQDMEAMVPKGILRSLDDVLTLSYWNSLPTREWEEHKAYKVGKHYYAGAVPFERRARCETVYFNKTLLDREGLTDPWTLMDKGKWTWEAFREIARKAQRDTDGDGKIDQWGWFRGITFLYCLIYSNGGSYTRTVGGREVFALDQPAALEACNFYYDLTMKDGIKAVPSRDRFVAGRVALMVEELGKAEYLASSKFDWGVLPIPRGPRMKQYTFPTKRLDVFVLPATVKDRDRARGLVDLVNALYEMSEPYVDREAFIKQEIGDRAEDFQNKRSYEYMKQNIFKRNQMLYHALPGRCVPSPFDVAFNKGTKTPAAALAEAKPQFQAMLDELTGYTAK